MRYLVTAINKSVTTVNGRRVAVPEAAFTPNLAVLELTRKSVLDYPIHKGFVPERYLKVMPVLILESVPEN
jgi:hypothetical protein